MAKDPTSSLPSASAQSQAQMGSAEPDYKAKKDPAKAENAKEIQFFDTTIMKMVEKENEETGEKEWVEVMSDNLYPGEKLKSVHDEEMAEKSRKADSKNADKDQK